MIPILNHLNKETGQFRKTLADELLAPYDNDLAIEIVDEKGETITVPVWRFIERYLRLKDKKGKFRVFEINRAQCEFYIELCKQKRAGRSMRINILKARQLGFSTFIAAILFVLTILVPNQTACIIADEREHATTLFKKYKFYYANLPDYFKKLLPLVASNAKELTVDYGMGQTSTIRVLTQGENAGRSDTCQYLHLSEVAFWQDIEDTTASILQTVDDNNPNSIIVYETTANGVNGYKTLWDADVASGEVGFKALFYAWYLDPDYVREYWDFELFDWEKKIMREFGLSLNQIAWYRTQYNKLRGNLDKLRQEFPTSPIEAFIVSGNSMFNMELLMEQKAKLMNRKPLKQGFFAFDKRVNQDGSQITLTNIHWVDSEVGSVKIYEEPQRTMPYIVNNDPAMGGEDYFATQVVNNYTGKQCAVYHKNKCDADDAAYQMYCLGKYYNIALVSGETNTTSYLLKLVYKCGYRFIYQDQDYEALSGRYQDKFGYKTKQNNRTVMLELFAEAFRDNPEIVQDYETICEMENFHIVKNPTSQKEKAQAVSGKHDDLVMAFAGIYLCRQAQRSIPTAEIGREKISIDELEDIIIERKRNQQQNKVESVYQVWD